MMSESAAASGQKRKESPADPIEEYLQQNGINPSIARHHEVIDKTILWKVKTEMNNCDYFSYFLTDGSIKFRHGGNNTKLPEKFFLLNRENHENTVLVEFAASGSGKTVDLAGSSVSRGAHLAILMSLHETGLQQYQYQQGESERESMIRVEDRNIAAFESISVRVESILRNNKHLQEIRRIASRGNRLRVVIAIDETSSCPLIARSIISDRVGAGKKVVEALGLVSDKVKEGLESDKVEKVLFSLGGTGASVACVGSNTANYESNDPSARSPELHKKLCNYLLGENAGLSAIFPGETEPLGVTATSIKENLPVLWTLMENGRMASIAATTLRDFVQKEDSPCRLSEANLVSMVVEGYIESNGMKGLKEESQHIVAACALAVDLFQWKEGEEGENMPTNPEEFASFMNTMKCGVTFTEYARKKIEPNNPIKTIVSQYGLLEPTLNQQLRPGNQARDIFVMKPAQQLVALTMLGMDATIFLQASPFGFEVLSTHIIKCAIAASSVIEDKTRPTLQKALGMIGFRVDSFSTSPGIQAVWEGLDKIKVVDHEFSFGSQQDDKDVMETRPMQVELEHLCNYDGVNFLQIDSVAFKALKAMHSQLDSSDCLGLPSAWINYGPSPLADGFVTFYCKGATDPNAFKFTVMNQAKDYHNGTKLHIKKVNEHADRCSASVLAGVFGERRLLCVAGVKDVVLAKRMCAQKRSFIPYVFDHGRILKDLLKTLESQRNVTTRVRNNTIFCDGKGEVVSGTSA